MAKFIIEISDENIGVSSLKDLFANSWLNGKVIISKVEAAQPLRAADAADWCCPSCGFDNHAAWRKCGNCEMPRP